MTYPANYNKKNIDDNDSNSSSSSNNNNNEDNINLNNISSNNSNNNSTIEKNKNNNITKNVDLKNSNKKDNYDDDKSNITIKRSTFTKLAIIGVAALMVSAFFAGYTLHQGISPTYVTLPSSPSTTTANSSMPSPTTTALAPPPPSIPAPTTIASVSLDDDPLRGNKDASITLIEFSDFQCPFCKRTYDGTMPDLKAKYIDTGKIKHVYRDYPLPIHQNAIPAAIAADCANEQGKFWDYHDILFTKQTEWENLSGNATNAQFKEYATNNLTGIDTNKFKTCIDSQKYKDEVVKDIAEGSLYGVSGTPTFYIGNEEKGYTQIVGAQPLTSFENVINQLSVANSVNG